MEKKTIGTFIAVLRKANGMTQKDFAEKLNMSDKAVSRWERDECAPDLSLLPVIAEIFGVTCDEILRGERRPASSQGEDAPDARKTDKQIRQLYAGSLQRYQSRLLTAAGLTVASALVMLICTYGFYQSVLGFGLAMALAAGSLIFIIDSASRAMNAAGDEECGGDQAVKYRRTLIRYFIAAVCANVVTAICLAPLVLLHSAGYAKRVLRFYSWLPVLPLYLLIAAGACIVIYLAVKWKTVRNPRYAYTDKEKRNVKLQARSITWFGAAAAVLLAAFLAFASVDPILYAAKTRYDSLASLTAGLGESQGDFAYYREYSGLTGTRWYDFTVNGDTNYMQYVKTQAEQTKLDMYPASVYLGTDASATDNLQRDARVTAISREDIYVLPDGQADKIPLRNLSFALIHIGKADNGSVKSYAVTWDSLDKATSVSWAVSIALLALCVAVPVTGIVHYFRKRER
jgi:transcriptional regulator with XRE-family HTH domain